MLRNGLGREMGYRLGWKSDFIRVNGELFRMCKRELINLCGFLWVGFRGSVTPYASSVSRFIRLQKRSQTSPVSLLNPHPPQAVQKPMTFCNVSRPCKTSPRNDRAPVIHRPRHSQTPNLLVLWHQITLLIAASPPPTSC